MNWDTSGQRNFYINYSASNITNPPHIVMASVSHTSETMVFLYNLSPSRRAMDSYSGPNGSRPPRAMMPVTLWMNGQGDACSRYFQGSFEILYCLAVKASYVALPPLLGQGCNRTI